MSPHGIKPRHVAIAFWFFIVSSPIIDAQVSEALAKSREYTVAWRVGFALLCYGWIWVETIEKKLDSPKDYLPFCVLLPELTVPFFVIRTRGWREFFLWFGKVSLLVLSACLVAVLLDGVAPNLVKL